MDFSLGIFPAFVLISCILVVIFTELIKSLDKKDRLKGYRVWIPFLLSAMAACALALGDFFPVRQAPFWGAAVFGISVFFFEAILKKIKAVRGEG